MFEHSSAVFSLFFGCDTRLGVQLVQNGSLLVGEADQEVEHVTVTVVRIAINGSVFGSRIECRFVSGIAAVIVFPLSEIFSLELSLERVFGDKTFDLGF